MFCGSQTDRGLKGSVQGLKGSVLWVAVANVKTNVGKLFFAALEENFGKDNPLNKIFNKRTVKMSYRTVPNFKKIISSHNKKLTKGVPEDPPCNCHNKDECPLDGQCNRNNIVYQATVTPSVGPVETYIGMTKNTFKERQKDHRKSVKHLKWSTETTYSTYIWELKKKNVDFSVYVYTDFYCFLSDD